jgi:hypothetical protein
MLEDASTTSAVDSAALEGGKRLLPVEKGE